MRSIKDNLKNTKKSFLAVVSVIAICILFSCSDSVNQGNVVGERINEDDIDFVMPPNRVSLTKEDEPIHENSFSIRNAPLFTEIRHSGKYVTVDDSLFEYGALKSPQCQYYLCYDCIDDSVPQRPFLLADCTPKTSDYSPTFGDYIFNLFQPLALAVTIRFKLYSYPLDDEYEFSVDNISFDYYTVDWKDNSVAHWRYISYLRSGNVALGYMYFGLEREATTEWITEHVKSWLVCSRFDISTPGA